MARMLQALKNLDARSKSTGAKGWLAHLAEKPLAAEPRAVTVAMPPTAKAENPRAAPVEQESENRIRPVRRADVAREVPAVESPRVDQSAEAAAPVEARIDGLDSDARQECLHHVSEVSARKPGGLERQIRRTLNDPARSQPLAQLADRLQREAEQTASKTLLLVGVGPHSRTHEVLVHVAALLPQNHGQRVLLIDADLARRSLSEALELGQASGLAEGLRSNKPVRDRFQATALPGVSLLPAGRGQPGEITAEAARLEEILREAAGQNSLVLVDGGRSVDKSARLLGRLVDAVYFVVQLGEVETSEAQQALADFRAAGARVTGCIAT